jgi:hypothetical protein
VIPDEERELRFQRWQKWMLKNIGFADSKLLRYVWDLYDDLIQTIQDLKKEIKQLKNKPTQNNN